MKKNFFRKLHDELFPFPDKYLDVKSGEVFETMKALLDYRRGRQNGSIRVLRRNKNETDWK